MNSKVTAKLGLVLAALLLSLSIAKTASAEIYLEPYLGYTAGKWEKGTDEAKYRGPNYGLRAGYSMLGFAIGAEYGVGNYNDDASAGNRMTNTDIGLFAGFEFPILVRVYATYFPKSKAKFDGTSTGETFDGRGLKFGLGFTALPFLAINLEYQTNTYNESTKATTVDELKSTQVGINVSLPFAF